MFSKIRHAGGDRKCWDTVGQSVNGGPIGVFFCHGQGGNQVRGTIKHVKIGLVLC